MKVNRTNKIENYLKENNMNYIQRVYSIDVYGYKQKYDLNIDCQFNDYIVSKYLDGSYVCEVECKTQTDVIRILSY